MRDHLKAQWRNSGVQPEQLKNLPELPEQAAHLWRLFHVLRGEAGSNGMTHNRITSGIIREWMESDATPLQLWERRAIRAVDDAFFRYEAGRKK